MTPAEELATLVADLRAWTEWTALCGGDVLPAEDVPPPTPLPRHPPAAPPRSAPARSGGPLPGFRPPAAPPTRPALAAPPPAAPAPAPAVASAPSPAGQLALGRWAKFAAAPAEEPLLSAARSLDDVRAALGDCSRCGLCQGRSRLVFGVGAPRARLMVVGEAPGFHEDQQGEPFVGKAGQMLDRMLSNVLGLQRSDVYITNVVKCRPPDNRNPQADEIARCRPFLRAQLQVVDPDFLLVLGSIATRTVFQGTSGVTRVRGQWKTLRWPGGSARAIATFHPAYLLRQPQDKRLALQDLQTLKEAMSAV